MSKISNNKMDIQKKAQAYKGDNSCRLCLKEKLYIQEHAENKLLNKRSKLISKCQYSNFSCVFYHMTSSIFIRLDLVGPNSLSLHTHTHTHTHTHIYVYICVCVCV